MMIQSLHFHSSIAERPFNEFYLRSFKVPSATREGYNFTVEFYPDSPICNCGVSETRMTCQHIARVKRESTVQIEHHGILTHSKDRKRVSYLTAPDYRGRWFEVKDIIAGDDKSITVSGIYLDRHPILKGVAK